MHHALHVGLLDASGKTEHINKSLANTNISLYPVR